MSNCIMTYTGKRFDPTNPDISLVDIRDIAHALSLTCRGNGHVQTFFSVGQHCLNCAKEAQARGYDRRVVLAALLHDASEAYMSDVPRPFKQALPEYVAAEESLLAQIYEKFLGSPLTQEEQALIKAVDDDMLHYDMNALFRQAWGGEPPQIKITLDYTVVPFSQVEEEFVKLFEQLQ